MTKLVECPVVDRVPARDTTLYKGQLYIPLLGIYLSTLGIK
jgi:hypothetical protein